METQFHELCSYGERGKQINPPDQLIMRNLDKVFIHGYNGQNAVDVNT